MKWFKAVLFLLAIPVGIWADSISLVDAPAQFVPGTIIDVNIDYQADLDRDYVIYLKQNGSKNNYAWERVHVSAGSRVQTFAVGIYPAALVGGNDYTLYIRVIDVDGKWSPVYAQHLVDGLRCVDQIVDPSDNIHTAYPNEYNGALVTALKGMRPSNISADNEYNTLRFDHISWNELEQNETDTVEQIIARCNARWEGYEALGLRVIPHMNVQSWHGSLSDGLPNGLTEYDYYNNTPEFERRLRLLIEKLGAAWDNDPRIAWVNVGIYGVGGSHESPDITLAQQAILSSAYNNAFSNKKIMMNFSQHFTDQEYGVYNRSWAHYLELDQLEDIKALNENTGRWKVAPITGRVSYYHDTRIIHPGFDADDTLCTPSHLEFLLDSIRSAHCSALGSIGNYVNSASAAGAAEVQKAMGYRFVIDQASWQKRVEPGENLTLSFLVKNRGSAPFYYQWPVYLYLLDPVTKEIQLPVLLDGIDIRNWLPGDKWDDVNNEYQVQAITYEETATITIPSDLPSNEYIVALAIADPFDGMPAVRFAINNYFNGGLHPLGYVGIGYDVTDGFDIYSFDDPGTEAERKAGLAYSIPVPNEPAPVNLLQNGDFTTSTTHWGTWSKTVGDSSLNAVNGEAHLAIITGGPAQWAVNLHQGNIAIEVGKNYTVTFDMRCATGTKSLSAKIRENGNDWTTYHQENNINVNSTMQTYAFTFQANTSDASAQFMFQCGGDNNDLYIDNVSIVAQD